jgi:hypothetical protein
MAPHLEASPPAYVPHDPRQTILYQVVAAHLETFLATVAADPTATGLPAYVVDDSVTLFSQNIRHNHLGAFACKHAGFDFAHATACEGLASARHRHCHDGLSLASVRY